MFTSIPRLVPSVITSSAILPLPELFREVLDIHGDPAFDLLVLRPEDISDLREAAPVGADVPITDLMIDHYAAVRDWVVARVRDYTRGRPDHRLRIAALATYFPDVSSMDEARREKACRAIANCVRLCHDLMAAPDLGVDVTPCVEIVCGSLLERAADDHWVIEYTHEAKIHRLVRSLTEVTADLRRGGTTHQYAIALELEPGAGYVLRDHDSLRQVHTAVVAAGLGANVGLNLDIAHFRIADIGPGFLRGEEDGYDANKTAFRVPDLTTWLVHGHIADHPLRMHTRDLALGAFTNLEAFETEFCPYLDLLLDRAAHAIKDPGGLLFTNTIAVELEGCSRVGWIHDSLIHLKRLIRAAEGRPRRTRPQATPPGRT